MGEANEQSANDAAIEAYEGFVRGAGAVDPLRPVGFKPWRELPEQSRRAWSVACRAMAGGVAASPESMRVAYESACAMVGSAPYAHGISEAEVSAGWGEAQRCLSTFDWMRKEIPKAAGHAIAPSGMRSLAAAFRAAFWRGTGEEPDAEPAVSSPWGMALAAAVSALASGEGRKAAAFAAARSYADASRHDRMYVENAARWEVGVLAVLELLEARRSEADRGGVDP